VGVFSLEHHILHAVEAQNSQTRTLSVDVSCITNFRHDLAQSFDAVAFSARTSWSSLQVEEGKVRGWDDPRLATINGLRRRGYPAEALNAFCNDVGVSRTANTILLAKLEHCCREVLDRIAIRAFAVIHPLKVTLTNFPDSEVTWIEAANFPRDKALGVHKKSLTKTLYIEADDFREVDNKDYFGLAPGESSCVHRISTLNHLFSCPVLRSCTAAAPNVAALDGET
jgi:glutamyl/glutaminyl-tRNA synthetase